MSDYKKTARGLYQVLAEETQNTLLVPAGINEVELTAKGGDIVVSVGDGPQDVEYDGVVLLAGESRSFPVAGDDSRVACALAGGASPAVLQVLEYVREQIEEPETKKQRREVEPFPPGS